MKKKLSLVFALLMMVMLSYSCTLAEETIKPSKTIITRDYKVAAFKQIESEAVADIFYTQSVDGKTTVKIVGPDNLVDLMQVGVKGDVLLLTMDLGKKAKNSNLDIFVSSPQLSSVDIKGVGNLYIKEHFTTPQLAVITKGVGDIHILDIETEKLFVDSKGVGNVHLEGVAQFAQLSSKGVGNIKAESLRANHVVASSKGVGNISCYATQKLEADSKGIGSIRYKGNPTQKELNRQGIGSIKSDE